MKKYINIENNMDTKSIIVACLYNILVADSIVLVPNAHTGAFLEVCRDMHTPANGGSLAFNTSGEVDGQYFYVEEA